ncbi:hypothetical protein LSAT2_005659 [Lamellibrachia satsuma]|nr:hypothetical protein LSAT2_005659 [Lamellibrachia satsuma]
MFFKGTLCLFADNSIKEKKALEDSFDRVPKASRPNYAYREVVRKQAERRQLEATVCPQCEQYFSTLGLKR